METHHGVVDGWKDDIFSFTLIKRKANKELNLKEKTFMVSDNHSTVKQFQQNTNMKSLERLLTAYFFYIYMLNRNNTFRNL